MIDFRPVHWPSPNLHQKGYTACGRKMSTHVKTTPNWYHITCAHCSKVFSVSMETTE